VMLDRRSRRWSGSLYSLRFLFIRRIDDATSALDLYPDIRSLQAVAQKQDDDRHHTRGLCVLKDWMTVEQEFRHDLEGEGEGEGRGRR
jgi:hypothetical protein